LWINTESELENKSPQAPSEKRRINKRVEKRFV
jgi:hypothetical protein